MTEQAQELTKPERLPMIDVSELTIEVDIDSLQIGDLMDLESAYEVKQIADWLVAHTDLDMQTVRRIKATQFKPLAQKLGETVRKTINPNQ